MGPEAFYQRVKAQRIFIYKSVKSTNTSHLCI
jgi:hypothetical protein